MTLANLGDLMRDTGEPEPLSLLDGDGFVLRNVRERLEGQFAAPATRAPGRFRLILTGTEIQGIPIEPIMDSYGASVPRVEHRLQFRFAAPDAPAGWLPLDASSVPQIARAARTTSSFPFAFEPSSITGDDFATGVWTRRGGPVRIDRGKGRWAIDGGVLDNSPIQPVLNEIWETPTADGPQRRCIVFVTPYSTEPAGQPPRQAPLSSVLGATFMVPRDVPHVDDLAELADAVSQQRQADTGDGSLLLVPDEELAAVAGAMAPPFAHYRRVRALQTAAGKAGIPVTNDDLDRWARLPEVIAAVWTAVPAPALSATVLATPEDWRWSSEHVRSAGLRWRARLAAARRALPADAKEGAAGAARAGDPDPGRGRPRTRGRERRPCCRRVARRDRACVRRRRGRPAATADEDAYAERVPDPLLRALVEGYAMYAAPAEVARANSAAWHDAIGAIAGAVASARAAVAGHAAAASVLLGRRSVTAQRLLQVEAILQALTSSPDVEAHPGVESEFLRLSTRPLDEHPLSGRRIPSSFAYLYGGQLGHFAGFVRGSWRAHDWMMGRLDGATAVMNLLLNERRVAEAGLSNADLAALLEQAGHAAPRGLPSNDLLPDADELARIRARLRQGRPRADPGRRAAADPGRRRARAGLVGEHAETRRARDHRPGHGLRRLPDRDRRGGRHPGARGRRALVSEGLAPRRRRRGGVVERPRGTGDRVPGRARSRRRERTRCRARWTLHRAPRHRQHPRAHALRRRRRPGGRRPRLGRRTGHERLGRLLDGIAVQGDGRRGVADDPPGRPDPCGPPVREQAPRARLRARRGVHARASRGLDLDGQGAGDLRGAHAVCHARRDELPLGRARHRRAQPLDRLDRHDDVRHARAVARLGRVGRLRGRARPRAREPLAHHRLGRRPARAACPGSTSCAARAAGSCSSRWPWSCCFPRSRPSGRR